MAKSLLITSNFSTGIAENLTRYIGIATGLFYETTESDTTRAFRTAGILSNFNVLVRLNTVSGNSTLNVRKNTADGNLSVSITGSTTGQFSDISNTDTVAAGDNMNFKFVTGTGSSNTITLSQLYLVFNPDDRSLTYSLASASIGASSSSNGVGYVQLSGNYNGNLVTTEAFVANDINITGTMKNLYVNTIANTKNASSTVRIRKNAGNGNLVVTMGASTTGVFEDTSNTDSIALNDDVCYARDTSASSSGSLSMTILSVEMTTTDNTFMLNGGTTNGLTTDFNSKWYTGLSGRLNLSAVISSKTTKMMIKTAISNLTAISSANTCNETTTWYLLKNSVAANGTISITASTTGTFEDTTNTDLFYPDDEVAVELNTQASGSGSISYRAYGAACKSYEVMDILGRRGQTPYLR
jgi:hypothetical protein